MFYIIFVLTPSNLARVTSLHSFSLPIVLSRPDHAHLRLSILTGFSNSNTAVRVTSLLKKYEIHSFAAYSIEALGPNVKYLLLNLLSQLSSSKRFQWDHAVSTHHASQPVRWLNFWPEDSSSLPSTGKSYPFFKTIACKKPSLMTLVHSSLLVMNFNNDVCL